MKEQPPKVFISYSHKDEKWKDRLVSHLGVLQNDGQLYVWDDRRIVAGSDWAQEIETALQQASAAVLLISAHFLNSQFILSQEAPQLLQRREKEGLLVVPVIISSCPWNKVSWLSAIQCRPTDGKALASFKGNDRDEELSKIAIEISDLLSRVRPPEKLDKTPFLIVKECLVLIEEGKYEEAQHKLERALQREETKHGPQHPNVAFCLNYLGEVHYQQERFRQARECFARALTIYEANEANNQAEVASCLTNLGAVLRKQHDYPTARTYLNRALQILTDKFGRQHIEVSSTLNTLGNIFYDEGRFADAQAHYEQALAIDESLTEQNPTDAAVTLNNLGKALHAQGNFSAAREKYQQALQICQELLGDEHPGTLEVQRNLERLPE